MDCRILPKMPEFGPNQFWPCVIRWGPIMAPGKERTSLNPRPVAPIPRPFPSSPPVPTVQPASSNCLPYTHISVSHSFVRLFVCFPNHLIHPHTRTHSLCLFVFVCLLLSHLLNPHHPNPQTTTPHNARPRRHHVCAGLGRCCRRPAARV